MDVKAFPALIVGVVVALVLMGAVLPGFVSASASAGDEITKSNVPISYSFPYYNYYSGDMEIILSNGATDTNNANLSITVNGETVDKPATWSAFHGVIGNNFIIDISGSSVNKQFNLYLAGDSYNSVAYSLGTTTITYDKADSEVTITVDGQDPTVIEGVTSIIGIVPGVSKYVTVTNNVYTDVFVNDSVIENKTAGAYVYYGNVTIGANTIQVFLNTDSAGDHFIIYKGETDTNTYTARMEISGLELASGTTDISTNGTPQFKVTNGTDTVTLTPIKSLVINEVKGHANSGALYSLLQILPLLIGAGLVTGAVAWFIARKK